MTLLSRRLLLGLLVACATQAQAQGTRERGLNTPAKLAIKGYDPVAYFTEGRPVKGLPEFTAEFDDATYWFKSADNRGKFVADPDRYAPQFGGLCAVSVSRGQIVEPDPEAWTIAEGKLYLFGAKQGVAAFHQQTASILEQASENWQDLHRRR